MNIPWFHFPIVAFVGVNAKISLATIWRVNKEEEDRKRLAFSSFGYLNLRKGKI